MNLQSTDTEFSGNLNQKHTILHVIQSANRICSQERNKIITCYDTLSSAISGENSQHGIHRFRKNFQIIFRKEYGYDQNLQSIIACPLNTA
jgi:hypothetical protein